MSFYKLLINQWFGDEQEGQIIICEKFYSLRTAVEKGKEYSSIYDREDFQIRRYEYRVGHYPVATFDEDDTGTLVYDSIAIAMTREKVGLC